MKHSDCGTTVHITLDAAAAAARIVVRDEGQGIAPALLPHVFEPYRQGDGLAARSGLGLGLAIVRQLVELHGGRVEASSPGVGQGACFTVLLPRTP
jgi:two-component system, chemotaxis family, CheB/CheR fusion protein